MPALHFGGLLALALCLPHNAQLQGTLEAGRHLYHLGEFDAARTQFERGLSEAERAGDRDYVALFLTGIGATQDAQDQYPAALTTDRAALAIYVNLGCRSDEAKELVNLGSVDEALARLEDAKRQYRAALELYDSLHDRDGQAKALNSLGVVEDDLGEYPAALSDGLAAGAAARATGDAETEAESLDNVGNAQSQLGRYVVATVSYDRALELYRHLPDQPNVGIARALVGIGRIDDLAGRYDAALRTQRDAFDVAIRIGKRDEEAVALENFANTQDLLGAYDDALAKHQQALAIFESIGDSAGIARELTNIGNVRLQRGDAAGALSTYEQALTLHRKLGALGGEADDLTNIGQAQAELQRYAAALRSQRTGYDIHRRLKNLGGEANDLGNIANLQQATGEYADAAENAQRALTLDESLGVPRWKALRALAAADASLDRIAAALRAYEAAIDDIEQLRAGLSNAAGSNGSNRSFFFGTTLLVYDQYTDYLLNLKARFPNRSYDRKALEIFERRQGRAFLEQIASVDARRFSGVPAAVLAQERELGVQANLLRQRLTQARSSTATDRSNIAWLSRELAGVQMRQRTLDAQIAQRYPAYYALRHPQPLQVQCSRSGCTTFAKFQARVLHRDEAVLVYDVLPSRIALWAITSTQIALVTIQGDARAAAVAIRAFAPGVCAPSGGQGVAAALDNGLAPAEISTIAGENTAACAKASFALAQWLLPQAVRNIIANVSTVFVVPSGPLYGVPFEALATQLHPDGSAAYLIESKAVAYLSSASLLNVLRTRANRPKDTSNLLAFANPAYSEAAGTTRDNDYVQLPGSEIEARAAFAALGITRSTDAAPPQDAYYAGDRATKAMLESLNASNALASYRYVLFGTHAILTDVVHAIVQPSIVLAHPVSSNGFLTMSDAFGLSLNAQAVILSSCDSAGGRVTGGDGVQGLTQALMFAGARLVGVTDWEVVDSIQERLTPAFFAAMAAGRTPAQAMQQAKLALLHSSDPLQSDPFFWAPMVVFGDGGS